MIAPFDSTFVDARISKLLDEVTELPEGSDEQYRVEHLIGELQDRLIELEDIPQPDVGDPFADLPAPGGSVPPLGFNCWAAFRRAR